MTTTETGSLPYLPTEVWVMILSDCDPKTLVACRSTSRQLHDVLDSGLVWAASRDKTFGPGCPPPPPNMSDAQYAELTQGRGCQERLCMDTRSKKIYWAMQMRLCMKCYKKRFCACKELTEVFSTYPGLRECLMQHRFDRGKRYREIGFSFPDGGLVAFDRREVCIFSYEFAMSNGKVDQDWYKEHVAGTKALTVALETCEDFFQFRIYLAEKERKDNKQRLSNYLEQRATELAPPLSVNQLHNSESFEKVMARHQTASHSAVWERLRSKLQIEMSNLG